MYAEVTVILLCRANYIAQTISMTPVVPLDTRHLFSTSTILWSLEDSPSLGLVLMPELDQLFQLPWLRVCQVSPLPWIYTRVNMYRAGCSRDTYLSTSQIITTYHSQWEAVAIRLSTGLDG